MLNKKNNPEASVGADHPNFAVTGRAVSSGSSGGYGCIPPNRGMRPTDKARSQTACPHPSRGHSSLRL